MAVGFMGTLTLTYLTAQSVATFNSGEVVSAGTLNANFTSLAAGIAGLNNRVNNPVALQFTDPPTVNFPRATLTDVPGFSLTVTTTGEPVWVGLTGRPSSGGSLLQITSFSPSSGCDALISIARNSTEIYAVRPRFTSTDNTLGVSVHYLPSSIWTVDQPPAGTHTYTIRTHVVGSVTTCTEVNFSNIRMIAFRLLGN